MHCGMCLKTVTVRYRLGIGCDVMTIDIKRNPWNKELYIRLVQGVQSFEFDYHPKEKDEAIWYATMLQTAFRNAKLVEPTIHYSEEK